MPGHCSGGGVMLVWWLGGARTLQIPRWVTIPGRLEKLEDGLPFGFGSSDIVGLVNCPLPLIMPMRPLGVTPSQFPWHWSATLVPVGDDCRPAWTRSWSPSWWPGARSQTGSHATRLGNLKGGGFEYNFSNSGRGPNPSHSEMDGSRSWQTLNLAFF